ncbi:sensor histidine kinase [Primorskyibacter sp. S87]|uniref:sensor histidine kinase n=1 Tax=Primorskyibacter sp. S87 TaxID=3415126 RepID=UPI003C7C1CCF
MGLLLGGIQLVIWVRLKSGPEFLLAAIMAFSAGALAICEAGFLGQPTAQAIQFRLEIQNVAIATMLIAMVWFVYLRLQSGRKWLAWSITATWIVCAISSLASPGNLTFSSVDHVEYLTTPWGETYSVASGQFHPLKILADLASLAIAVFVTDATVAAYKAGRRRQALRSGGSILLFIVVAGVHTPLVDAGIVQTPFIISLVFVAICFSLALDLADDAARSVRLNAVLLKERQRWNALTENVDLAVIRVDAEGRIAYVNPFLERISGRASGELDGVLVTVLVPDEHKSEVAELAYTTHNWTTRARKRRALRTVQGDTREIVWYSVALTSEAGHPDGFISFGQDITDLLKAEDESQSTRQEIERLTRAVALGELSSSLAHELSQPIAAILSNTQTLQILRGRSGKQLDETDEILKDIFADSQRAKDLMHRVRGFMFNQAPIAEPFDLGEAAAEVLDMVSGEAQRNRVSIELPDKDREFPVEGARLEIQQVLMNLLLNAIQAIGNAGPTGVISVTWDRTGEKNVKIQVDDTGPGLTAEMRASIFDPFVTTKPTGTGIGLAVSKRIVERHGGDIAAGNSDLGGAQFSLELPIYLNEASKLRA